MSHKDVLVIGASGDVGRGAVTAALDHGWQVTAVGRSAARLDEACSGRPGVTPLVADVACAEGAAELAQKTADVPWAAVVVAVNSPAPTGPLLGRPYTELADYLAANLAPHLNCLTAFVPALRPGAVFLGIGGGMADFVLPGLSAPSIVQAAQRMAYRHAAKEARPHGVVIRELLIRSMVAGASNREVADPGWLTDRQIGERVCELIADPLELKDPVVVLDP